MNKKHKENIKNYFKLLPLIGLLTSIFLFILFFIIYDVEENGLIVVLYCLLPLLVYSSIYILYIIIRKI